MFLNPSAKPTPRRTPSPRVVLPAPPGSRSGSRGSASGVGQRQRRGPADHLARRQRARDDLPVGSASPGSSAFRSRSSTGSIPSSVGEPVHLRLAREARLHGAEAAHRAARRVVRVDRRRLDQRVVDAVRPERERRGVRGHRGRARGVRAAVEQDPHADAGEPAVAGRPVLAPDPRRMAMDVTGERLRAVVDHLHRPVRCAARAASRGSASTGPRARRTRRRPRRGGCRTCSGARPRHGATWSRSTWSHCVATWMSTPPSPSGTARPDSGPRNAWSWIADLVRPGRRRPRRASPGRRGGSRCADDVRPRVVAVAVTHRRAVRVERLLLESRAPCRRPARAARTRRRSRRARAAPARDARPRRCATGSPT